MREIYKNTRYNDFDESLELSLFSHGDPTNFEEAIKQEK